MESMSRMNGSRGDGLMSQAENWPAQPTMEFATDNACTGFRLDSLQVFNWGTFHGRIWTIEPRGRTALLTGANGSGKSTLVDAILTLLVPNVKRGYNLASGADTRKERDERSYVLGAYGKFRGEEAATSQTRHLRDKAKDYSVILGSFHSEGSARRVVLAHVFYFQNGELRKFFVVSPHEMSIADHFRDFSDIRSLRQRLRAEGAQVFDVFSAYSKHFRRDFGLRSEKALDLFNQTVSIKVIGDLNGFVRAHMLEPGDPRNYIARLKRHFDDLTRTYEAIQKAKDQVEKLRPIDEDGKRYTKLGEQITRVEKTLQAVPGVFARREAGLLQAATRVASGEIGAASKRQEAAESELNGLRDAERDLDISISRDEIGRQIQDLENEIRRTEEERNRLRKAWESYRVPAAELGMGQPENADQFFRQRNEAQKSRDEAEAELQSLTPRRDEAKLAIRLLDDEIKESDTELESLRKRTSQIPFRHLDLRRRLLEDLDLGEDELPFIGELVQVRPEASAWEAAAERLLHGFALRLLVPERHYHRVNAYVDRTHLGGRLVYGRVPEKSPVRGVRDDEPDRLYNKLEVRPGTPWTDWLSEEIVRQYNHVCCDVERFRDERRAVTQNGLVKQSGALHEKDDRRSLGDRRHYILGWDNREKLRLIEADIERLRGERSELAAQLNQLEARQTQGRRRIQLLDQILRFTDFREIDKAGASSRIELLRQQKARLEESSDHLQQLRTERESVREAIGRTEKLVKEAEKKVTLLEQRLEDYGRRLRRCSETLGMYREEELATHGDRIEPLMAGSIDLDNVVERRDEVREALSRDLQNRGERRSVLGMKTIRAMQRFKSDYPQETMEIDASIEALSEYQRSLATLQQDDLPRHEKRFGELLSKKLMEDVSFFEEALFRQEDVIREKIEALNSSLQVIDYTPSSYIQLLTSASADAEVQEFKHLLRGIFADNTGDETANEASFQRIRDLIRRFDTEERWTNKVTDVRNWVDFSISERYRESDEEKNYITNSDGLSGGQKAKLAYTILAAAIAYQFGLDYGQTRSQSFRFVVIDEAFSKIDDDNARYAMELFRKLDLQLLVVSPLGATRVVEDYIGACHFIANNEDGSYSQVRNLTIDEYHTEKERARTVESAPAGLVDAGTT